MNIPHSGVPCTLAGHDILDHVAVSTPCGACGGRYDVTLRQILLSQELLHEGCPVQHERDCPPLVYGPLADRAAVGAFRDAWDRLADQIRRSGGELTLLGGRDRSGHRQP